MDQLKKSQLLNKKFIQLKDLMFPLWDEVKEITDSEEERSEFIIDCLINFALTNVHCALDLIDKSAHQDFMTAFKMILDVEINKEYKMPTFH